MADRKVYVDVTVRLIIRADDDASIDHILNELDYNFSDTTGKANIEDTEITNYNITDSK